MSHLWSCNRCFPFKEVLLSDWTRRNSIGRILSGANLVRRIVYTAATVCQVSCSGCSWCWSPPETSACTRPSVCVGPSPPSSLTTDPWQLWNHKFWHLSAIMKVFQTRFAMSVCTAAVSLVRATMGSESKRDRAAFSALYPLCLAEKLLQPPVEWDRGRGREGMGERGTQRQGWSWYAKKL